MEAALAPTPKPRRRCATPEFSRDYAPLWAHSAEGSPEVPRAQVTFGFPHDFCPVSEIPYLRLQPQIGYLF